MPLRHQDPTTGRWNGIDPVTHFSSSTYSGYNNNPVFWADPSGANVWCQIKLAVGVTLSNPYARNGLRAIKFGNKVRKILNGKGGPIDPRTGTSMQLDLYNASLYGSYGLPDVSKRKMDIDLYKQAMGGFGWSIFPRSRHSIGDAELEGGMPTNSPDKSLEQTTRAAVEALGKLFPSQRSPGHAYYAPNDRLWREAARNGTYTFLDHGYVESDFWQIDKNNFNIITVSKNYITQIVSLTRSSKTGKFNISSVTTFDIYQEKLVTGTNDNHIMLNVVEKRQNYVDNQPSGSIYSKQYFTKQPLK